MPVGNCCGWCLIYSYGIYAGCFCFMACRDLIHESIEKWKNDVDTRGFDDYEKIQQSLSIIEEEDSDDSDIFEEDKDAVLINNVNFMIKENQQNGLPKWTIS